VTCLDKFISTDARQKKLATADGVEPGDFLINQSAKLKFHRLATPPRKTTQRTKLTRPGMRPINSR
jgi:hypothetical protein